MNVARFTSAKNARSEIEVRLRYLGTLGGWCTRDTTAPAPWKKVRVIASSARMEAEKVPQSGR